SFFSRIISMDSQTDCETLSFPYNKPTTFSSKNSVLILAFFNASCVATNAYSLSSAIEILCRLDNSPFKSTGSTCPVKADRNPKSFLSQEYTITDFPFYKERFTSSKFLPKDEYIPIPVITTRFIAVSLGINAAVDVYSFSGNVGSFSRS